MKRISPEAVIDAYIATGRVRSPGQYFSRDECGACALGALYLANGGVVQYHGEGKTHPIGCEQIAKHLGLDFTYALYFSGSFEHGNTLYSAKPSELANAGNDDGLAAREAVMAHFNPAPEPAEAAQEPVLA